MKVSKYLRDFLNSDTFKRDIDNGQDNSLLMSLEEWGRELRELVENNDYVPTIEDSLLDVLDNANIDWLRKLNAISKDMQPLFFIYSSEYLLIPLNIKAIETKAFVGSHIKEIDYPTSTLLIGNGGTSINYRRYQVGGSPSSQPSITNTLNQPLNQPINLNQSINPKIAFTLNDSNINIMESKFDSLEDAYNKLNESIANGANGFNEDYLKDLIRQVLMEKEAEKVNILFNTSDN